MAIIGIDLGTTNSLVGVYENGGVTLIPNAHGEVLTPSVVSFLDDGTVIVGKAAKERQIFKPKLSASAFKRFMGTKKTYRLGQYTLGPVELSSFILKALKSDAEAYLKEPIVEAVISVPAYFNQQQRRATQDAARLAGLHVERFINEPTAAATAYHLNDTMNEKVVAIVDLGGGTFDVSILDIFDSILEVRAVAGDNFLGGEDFDQLMLELILIKTNKSQVDLSDVQRSKLLHLAEQIKRQLSEHRKVQFVVELFDEPIAIEIGIEEYDSMCEQLFIKLKEPLKKALQDSQFAMADISEVVMVGGSTRMPSVRSFIGKLFGKLPLSHLNPDEVIAIGATVCASMKSRNEDLKEIVLTDVCPYTLGIEITKTSQDGSQIQGIFDPIIERNTTVPVSYAKIYYPASPNQTHVAIRIYQGENLRVSDNLFLGELDISLNEFRGNEVSFNTRFTYDINGILEVLVTDSVHKKTVKKIITNSETDLSESEIEERFRLLESIKIHPRDQEENQLLFQRAERLYSEALGDLRDIIMNNILEFESVLMKQEPKKVKKAMALFKQFLDQVEGNYK